MELAYILSLCKSVSAQPSFSLTVLHHNSPSPTSCQTMYIFSHHFNVFGCYAAGLLACSRIVQAASGTLEVDLVFPQNDTYAPEPIIPVAFAFQHSELAGYLQPSIAFSISPYGNNSESIAGGYYDMTWTNFTSSDPYMQYGEGLEVLNTEGTWMLEWTLSITNCSSSGNLDFSRDSTRHRIVFTTKNGAKKPDLTAATGEDTCSNAQGYAFKIMETQDSGDHLDNGKACAVLAETTPTPSPCGVNIEASAASSVSASLTDRACAVETASWCPEPDEGVAQSLVVPSLAVGGVAFLAAALGGLGFLVI